MVVGQRGQNTPPTILIRIPYPRLIFKNRSSDSASFIFLQSLLHLILKPPKNAILMNQHQSVLFIIHAETHYNKNLSFSSFDGQYMMSICSVLILHFSVLF